ncbi:MAG: hypothetical protein ACWA40_08485 [Planktomarina sp.]
MPNSVQQSVDLMKQSGDLGFVEFTTGLLDGVYETVVGHQISQLKEYSELVAQTSGSVEDFVLNTSGLDVADASTATSNGNEAVLETYLIEVLGFGENVNSIDVTPALIQHFSPQVSFANADTVSRSDLKAEVFNKLKSEGRQQYELLLEIIRIGYARLDTTKGFVETSLDFKVTASDSSHSDSRATDIKRSSWYANASAGASFKKWGFKVNGGYAASRLRVNTTSSSQASAIDTDIRMTGRVRVEFATSTFDATMAKIANTDA